MQLENITSVGGKWIDKDQIKSGTKIKIVGEATVAEGQFGPQTVAKVLVKGSSEPVNLGINKTSIRGMISAFGTETKLWVGKIVTADVRRESVSGKMQNVLRLIPEGYELGEDENGYLSVKKIGVTSAGTPVPFPNVPTEPDISPDSINF